MMTKLTKHSGSTKDMRGCWFDYDCYTTKTFVDVNEWDTEKVYMAMGFKADSLNKLKVMVGEL